MKARNPLANELVQTAKRCITNNQLERLASIVTKLSELREREVFTEDAPELLRLAIAQKKGPAYMLVAVILNTVLPYTNEKAIQTLLRPRLKAYQAHTLRLVNKFEEDLASTTNRYNHEMRSFRETRGRARPSLHQAEPPNFKIILAQTIRNSIESFAVVKTNPKTTKSWQTITNLILLERNLDQLDIYLTALEHPKARESAEHVKLNPFQLEVIFNAPNARFTGLVSRELTIADPTSNLRWATETSMVLSQRELLLLISRLYTLATARDAQRSLSNTDDNSAALGFTTPSPISTPPRRSYSPSRSPDGELRRPLRNTSQSYGYEPDGAGDDGEELPGNFSQSYSTSPGSSESE